MTMTTSNWRDQATLTVDETAAILGISRWSAYARVRAGDVPVIKLGRRVLVPTARLRAMLGEVESTNDNGAHVGSADPVQKADGAGRAAAYDE